MYGLHRESDNLVARVNLPNMAWHGVEEKLDAHAQAVRGLLALEPSFERRAKYVEFVDIYGGLDDNERRLFEERYPREGEQMWPPLPYPDWRETCSALHLWSQIVGKYRLAHTPWVNHSWHATLYVTPRGLTTGMVPDRSGRYLALTFDFCDHALVVQADGGATDHFSLRAMSVADFYAQTKRVVASLGGTPDIHPAPNELPDPIPFAEDTRMRPYDTEAVERFHRALVLIERTFEQFRTGFVGKVSPVHLFWGALDLAVTRFSGRRAPLHPGGIPHLPDAITREAYSHEVSSAGFWPGGGGVDEAMFYSYAYPEPAGFAQHSVEPAAARYDTALHEFLLPYEAVRTAADPEGTLTQFLHSTYVAAAESGRWERSALECEPGRPRVPRLVVPPS
jgi:hypothetical protein